MGGTEWVRWALRRPDRLPVRARGRDRSLFGSNGQSRNYSTERPTPDYFLSGHSHVALDHREGTCRRINPGALYRADEYTVALLNLETDELEFLKVT